MSVRRLLLNGDNLSLFESIDISQDYEIESAINRRRVASGALIQRTMWTGKLRTTISGRGAAPSGLATFDFSVPYTLSCIAHRSVSSTSNVITIPAARRSDVGAEPYALAFTGAQWVHAVISGTVVDEYTITAIPGAEQYKLYYFPEISVLSDPPTESRSTGTLPFSWQLSAQEV